MKKYKIGDIISVKIHKYILTSPIIAIRNYGEFNEYLVNGMDRGFIDSEIMGKTDSEGNILF